MQLEIDRKLIKADPRYCHETTDIAVIDSTCMYNDFFQEYLLCNKPCIIKDIATNWNATKYWTIDNRPNLEYLRIKYGTCEVVIYDCKDRYYNSQKTKQSSLEEYIVYWYDFKKSNGMPLYYLKDWHLKNRFSNDDFYEVPKYFASDWLNEYLCENQKDDYRFVYMGPEGSWTPFHADVFTSYSWSVNICGQKRWLLFPPGSESYLKDSLGNIPYDVSDIASNIKYYSLLQNPGEAIFVPSGWHHQVWNLKDTISINHNWVNGCNINAMWLSLEDNLRAVKREIEDCRDMSDFLKHCQVMLQATYGLNFQQFYQFIKFIAVKRMNLLNSNAEINLLDNGTLGSNHALFDLIRVEQVLVLFCQHEDVNLLGIKDDSTPFNLLCDIKICIGKYI